MKASKFTDARKAVVVRHSVKARKTRLVELGRDKEIRMRHPHTALTKHLDG